SSLYSMSTLAAGLLLSVVGRLADRYGQKKMTIIVAGILGISCLWNSFISSLWMLMLGFFVGRLTGQGSMTLLPYTIVPKWFIKRRAFALSLASVGGVVGSAVIPPFNTMLIQSWGWPNTWRLWTFLLWLFFIPIIYFFQHNKPEDIGLLPDNGDLSSIEKDKSTKAEKKEMGSWTIKEAFKTHAFWFILYCHQVLPMIVTGVTFHFISILGIKGLTPATAAYVLSLIALASFPTTLIAGYILDHIKVHYAMAFACLLQLISLIILLNATTVLGGMIYAVIQGMGLGLNNVCNGVVWPNYFGTKYLGSIKGLAMTILVIGTAFGPLPLGIGFDLFGGYTEALICFMVFPALGVIGALISPKPIKK
ncbi:MAG: MFS transporter, partial [Clostridia bacterium]|nr:MFS transporter [Clostridia bacterium]